MVIFAIVVSTNQYVGEPITCWTPSYFSGSWDEYTNSYCWIQNTYYVPFEDYIPRQGEKRDMIPYYQWVPIILLIQGLLFYLPTMIWRKLNSRSGIDANSIMEAAESFQDTEQLNSF